MIKLIADPTFEAEVKIVVPGAEAPAATTFVFRTLDHKRRMSLLMMVSAVKTSWLIRQWEFLKLCIRARKVANIVDLFDEVVVSWDGFDLPYSKDSMRLLLTKYPDAMHSIFFAYFQGYAEARKKN